MRLWSGALSSAAGSAEAPGSATPSGGAPEVRGIVGGGEPRLREDRRRVLVHPDTDDIGNTDTGGAAADRPAPGPPTPAGGPPVGGGLFGCGLSPRRGPQGHIAQLTVKSGSARTGWTVSWPDAAASSIAGSWGLTCSIAGGIVSCASSDWTTVLDAGQTVVAGVQVVTSANPPLIFG